MREDQGVGRSQLCEWVLFAPALWVSPCRPYGFLSENPGEP